MLDCGHCSCKDCVEYTVKSEVGCPVCHKTTAVHRTSALPAVDSELGAFCNTRDMSSERNVAISTDTMSSTIFTRPKMKKSSSDEELNSFYDYNEVRRQRTLSEGSEGGRGIRFGDKQKSRSSSGEKDINSRAPMQNGVAYSVHQQTVEFPEASANGSCFEEKSVQVPYGKDVLLGLSMGDPVLDAGEYTVTRSSVQEFGNAQSNEGHEHGNYGGMGGSTDCADHSLEPDLITFEDVGACSIVGEDGSVSSAQDSVFTYYDRQRDDVNSVENLVQLQRHAYADGTGEVNYSEEDNIVGHCLDHDSPFSFMCITCNIWGCPSCVVSHQGPPFGHCFVVDPQEAIRTLKSLYRNGARVCVNNATRVKRRVRKEVSGVKVIADHYEKRAAHIRAELDVVENNLKELNILSDKAVNTNSDVTTIVKTLKEAYRKIKGSDNPEAVISGMNSLEKCKSTLSKYSWSELQRIPVIPNIQIHKKKEIIGLLEAGAPIYGVLERNGGKTYSHLTLEDGYILLHCLRDDVYPNDGVAILTQPFEFFAKLVPQKSATIFLDVGWAGERRGRVYVHLFGDTPRGRQALLLCSGEKGQSYVNTVFYNRTVSSSWTSANPQEILYGGDYENNDGTGGRAVVEDITNGGVYNHPTIDGLMTSWSSHEHWRVGSFSFYVHGNPVKSTDAGFGLVTQGLEILRAAAKQDPINSSYVCGCGLVIPI